MRQLWSFFVACGALIAQVDGGLHGMDTSHSGYESIQTENDDTILSQSYPLHGHVGRRTRTPLLITSVVVATAALVYILMKCFKTLASEKASQNYKLTRRKLSEEEDLTCSVRAPVRINSRTIPIIVDSTRPGPFLTCRCNRGN